MDSVEIVLLSANLFVKMETSMINSTSTASERSSGGLCYSDPPSSLSLSDIFDSTITTCREGLCWSPPSSATISSRAADSLEEIPTSRSVFDRIVYSCSSPVSMSLSNNAVDKQDYYASRWQGYLPLSPMPSTDSASSKKILSKRRRPVR